MKLSIITINYNNAAGLQKTMESVIAQSSQDFEYIVVDGGSTDGSKELICQYANMPILTIKWISEKDNGIYHAMNKGILMAKGEYVQFLNSGDMLAAEDVAERMLGQLSMLNLPSIMYGNMLKQLPKRILRDRCFAGRMPTMIDFYTGTLNHSSAYIKRLLFDEFGFYDESFKIVSDWKWYMQVILFGNHKPIYADIDVTIFDMNGISSVNSKLDKSERREVLEKILPLSIISDYDKNTAGVFQLKRINRYWFTSKGFWLVERILFKFEKWFRNKEQIM